MCVSCLSDQFVTLEVCYSLGSFDSVAGHLKSLKNHFKLNKTLFMRVSL